LIIDRPVQNGQPNIFGQREEEVMSSERSARLREIRDNLDLSQHDLGIVLGFDPETDDEIIERVDRYELGIKETPKTILRLAKMLERHGIPKDFWRQDYPEDATRQFHTIRKILDLSLVDYGIALGFQGNNNTIKSQIHRYESGERQVPPWILRLSRMFERFGIPDEYFDDTRPGT
jgi:transcriptional regulator with XRE-family HTH domain